jgi:hypothetical protein
MREAQLTVGTLLIFIGGMGAIGASTMNTGATITDQTLRTLLIAEVVSTIIAVIGGALVMRNR